MQRRPQGFQRKETLEELEDVDDTTLVSEGIMGFLALELAQLHPSEESHVFGLADFKMEYSKIKKVLVELYPLGSFKRGRSANIADGTQPPDGWNYGAWTAEGWTTQDWTPWPSAAMIGWQDETTWNVGYTAETVLDPEADEAENNVNKSKSHMFRRKTIWLHSSLEKSQKVVLPLWRALAKSHTDRRLACIRSWQQTSCHRIASRGCMASSARM